jgi:hypothetical protein
MRELTEKEKKEIAKIKKEIKKLPLDLKVCIADKKTSGVLSNMQHELYMIMSKKESELDKTKEIVDMWIYNCDLIKELWKELLL